ncbi:MAG: hypothetical protein FWE44_01500 [Defluviitaleaceae bacterium]|nr:hypothetical protein [Defluviitaleaceae bacterium]
MDRNEKIRLMAKMATYDKKGFERDAEANQYFRHDYIYKKNMALRFSVGVGCLILALFYFVYLTAVQGADIFALDFQSELIGFAIFVIVVMVFYSLMGTIIFTREYLASGRRVNEYFKLMRQLNGEAAHEEDESPKKAQLEYKADEDEEDLDQMWQSPYIPRRRREHLLTYDDDEIEQAKKPQMPEYRYMSSDDPSFWDEDEK